MLHKTEAIVLKSISYGDSSIISTLLTKEFGKVSIIAKGIKKNKSTNRALLDPLSIVYINFYLKKQRNTQILKTIDLSENIPCVRKNLDLLNTALLMVDILNNILPENEKVDLIFRLCKSTLLMLNEHRDTSNLLMSFFLIQLYIQLGYMPNFDNCSYCYKKINTLNLNLIKHQLMCSKCNSGNSIIINNKVLTQLKKMISTHITKIDTINLNDSDILLINNFLYHYGKIFLHGFTNIKSLKLDYHG